MYTKKRHLFSKNNFGGTLWIFYTYFELFLENIKFLYFQTRFFTKSFRSYLTHIAYNHLSAKTPINFKTSHDQFGFENRVEMVEHPEKSDILNITPTFFEVGQKTFKALTLILQVLPTYIFFETAFRFFFSDEIFDTFNSTETTFKLAKAGIQSKLKSGHK